MKLLLSKHIGWGLGRILRSRLWLRTWVRVGVFALSQVSVALHATAAVVWVDESFLSKLRVGQPARVVLRSDPSVSLDAEVARIGQEVDRESRELLVSHDRLPFVGATYMSPLQHCPKKKEATVSGGFVRSCGNFYSKTLHDPPDGGHMQHFLAVFFMGPR